MFLLSRFAAIPYSILFLLFAFPMHYRRANLVVPCTYLLQIKKYILLLSESFSVGVYIIPGVDAGEESRADYFSQCRCSGCETKSNTGRFSRSLDWLVARNSLGNNFGHRLLGILYANWLGLATRRRFGQASLVVDLTVMTVQGNINSLESGKPIDRNDNAVKGMQPDSHGRWVQKFRQDLPRNE